MTTRTRLLWFAGGLMLWALCTLVSPISGLLLLTFSLLVLTLFWAKGVIGTPGFVVQKRRAYLHNSSPRNTEPRAVASSFFPYDSPGWFRCSLWLAGIALSFIGMTVLAACVTTPAARSALGLGIVIGGFGLFLLRFAWRLPRLGVRVGPDDIAVEGILYRQQLRWDDILAMTERRYTVYGQALEIEYRLYGMDRSLGFSSKLSRSEELVSLLENHLPPSALN